jgi:hypothetical protein
MTIYMDLSSAAQSSSPWRRSASVADSGNPERSGPTADAELEQYASMAGELIGSHLPKDGRGKEPRHVDPTATSIRGPFDAETRCGVSQASDVTALSGEAELAVIGWWAGVLA